MKFNIKDRFTLLELLPTQGDIVSQTISRDIRKKVELTQKEMDEAEVKTSVEGGRMALKWNDAKDPLKDIEFTESEVTMLKGQVTELNNKKGITPKNLDVCLMLRDFQFIQEAKKDKPKKV